MIQDVLINLSTKIAELAKEKNLTLSLAESCTGGMLSGYITAVPGASEYFKGAFITYSDEIKTEILGVKANLIKNEGAVSEVTAKEMAILCLERAGTDIALAVTGIAGPSGGTSSKPLGTVCFAIAWLSEQKKSDYQSSEDYSSIRHHEILKESNTFKFSGDRQSIRLQSCERGLQLMLRKLQSM